MKNNDIRKTKEGYFNLIGYLSLIKIWKNNTIEGIGLWIVIICATRNMGKSYSTWDFIEKEIWEKYNYTKRIVYIRTNKEKLKEAARSFNASYQGKYCVIGTIIYKIDKDKKLNKNNPDNLLEIGRFVDVENEHNYRSGAGTANFTNYCFAFWDEFNEMNQIKTGFYQKFLMLYSTFKRKNKDFLFVIVGNKINANNDLYTKLELDISNHNFKKDFIQEIWLEDKKGVKHKKGFFIDIGLDTFRNINPEDDIINLLAAKDYETDAIFNQGSFLKNQAYNVVYYNQQVKPTKVIERYFIYKEFIIEYGKFDNDKTYFHLINLIPENNKLPVSALDMMGLIFSQESQKFGVDDYVDIVNRWSEAIKNRKLFFTSFDLKIEIEKYIITITDIWEQ